MTSESSGAVRINLDGKTPVILGYADTEVYGEMNLSDTKHALELLSSLLDLEDDETTAELPETFTGTIRLTFTETGQNSATMRLAVTEAIAIAGVVDGEKLNFSLAQSPDLLVMTTSETTANMTSNLAMSMGAMSMLSDNSTENPSATAAMQIEAGGLFMNLNLNDANNMIFTNSGITDSLSIKTGSSEADLVELMSMTLPSFNTPVALDGSTITFDSIFDLTLTLNDPLQAPSEFSIYANANTQVTTILANDGSYISKVLTGSLAISDTGAIEGSVTATANQCLGLAFDLESFPVELVSCPNTF